MVASIVERTNCRACDGPLEDIFDVGKQEVINFGNKEPLKAPLELTKCKECHLVQLRHTVDKDYLFRTYYFKSATSDTYRKHLQEVADDLMRRAKLKKGDRIVDIGANDGTMLKMFPDWIERKGFEPSQVAGESPDGLDIISDFFSYEAYSLRFKHQAQAVYCGFMFYDLDDPLSFLKDVKKVLAPDGLFVIEMNYLPSMLANNAVDNISHEHLCYYTLRTLENLLFRAGLQAEDVAFNDVNGGAFRVYIRHRTNHLPSDTVSGVLVGEQRFDNMAPYLEFKRRVGERMFQLRALTVLEHITKGKTIDLRGASTRGLTVCQLAGLDSKLIRFVVDANPEKAGKLYNGIPVITEEQSKQNPADIYVILPYTFEKEIRKSMTWGKQFVVPLPELRFLQ